MDKRCQITATVGSLEPNLYNNPPVLYKRMMIYRKKCTRVSLWVEKGVDGSTLPCSFWDSNHKKSIFCTIDCWILMIRTSLCPPLIGYRFQGVLPTKRPFWWQAASFVMVDTVCLCKEQKKNKL